MPPPAAAPSGWTTARAAYWVDNPWVTSPLFSHSLSYEVLVGGKGDFGGVLRAGLAGPPRGMAFAGTGRRFADATAGAGEGFKQPSPSDSSRAILFRGSFRTTPAQQRNAAQTCANSGCRG